MADSSWTPLVALLLASAMVRAEAPEGVDPLFAEDDTLTVRIVAPLSSIMDNRWAEEESEGSLQLTTGSDVSQSFSIGIRARGKSRRRDNVCTFAPLRLNFKKSETEDSLFHNQDKLKLVTHCRKNSKRYQRSVLAEYLAYRIFNTITDVSYRARLLRVTYVDSDNDNDEYVSYAFLIEHDDRLAARIDAPALEIPKASLADLRPDYTNLTSVFHYLIGNTDFSPKSSSPDTECCHNHALFAKEGDLYYSVPYDFDQSGLVNSPHASPNPRFGLRSVVERLYRGRCRNSDYLPATLELFRNKRGTINEIVRGHPDLDERHRKYLLRYIEKFYAVLGNPRMVEYEFYDNCV